MSVAVQFRREFEQLDQPGRRPHRRRSDAQHDNGQGSGAERSEPWPLTCERISELTLPAARSGVSGSRELSGAFGLAARVGERGADQRAGQKAKRSGGERNLIEGAPQGERSLGVLRGRGGGEEKAGESRRRGRRVLAVLRKAGRGKGLQKPDWDLLLDLHEIPVLRHQSHAVPLGQTKLIRIIEIQAKALVSLQDRGIRLLVQVQ